MTRVIQIRRGTTAEHEKFTGAIGELTMETDSVHLRVHDGATVGGVQMARRDEVPDLELFDMVVAWQIPNADNNYTWYRKYKSGWVEQGGRNSVTGHATTSDSNIPLPIEMASNSYEAIATINGAGENVAVGCSVYKLSSQAISLRINYGSNLTRMMSWRVCGMAA